MIFIFEIKEELKYARVYIMKLVYPIEQEDGAAMTYELQGSDKAPALFGGWNNVCLNFAIKGIRWNDTRVH